MGSLMAFSHFIINIPSSIQWVESFQKTNRPMMYPGWLFNEWLGGNSLSVHSFLYFMILPLLASLPFADSFYLDVTKGFISEICTRVHKSNYFAGKYIAVFFSGAVTAVFPLLLNFFLCLSIYPALKPEPTSGYSHLSSTSLSELYYNDPVIFLLIHYLMIFLMAGLLATFALSASYYCNYQFLALISPFLLYISMIAVFGLFEMPNWQPNNFLNPAYSETYYGDILTPYFVTCIMLIGLSSIFFFKGRKADIF